MYRTFDESGRLREEGFYRSDQPSGAYREYYPNGKVKVERTFQNGKVIADRKT